VRDRIKVAASDKVKGALAVSRGLLEFKADPDLPTHDPALRKVRPVILYHGSDGRAALAGKTLQRQRIQGFGRCRLGDREGLTTRLRASAVCFRLRVLDGGPKSNHGLSLTAIKPAAARW
jgi:hypothetical protein